MRVGKCKDEWGYYNGKYGGYGNEPPHPCSTTFFRPVCRSVCKLLFLKHALKHRSLILYLCRNQLHYKTRYAAT
jgi:hypothetical protein